MKLNNQSVVMGYLNGRINTNYFHKNEQTAVNVFSEDEWRFLANYPRA
jgi:hypothetical protein